MTHRPHSKRRFTATRTPPRLYALAQDEDRRIIDNDTIPRGVTAPSPTCLPDSVLALVCPRCLAILYISRGMYSVLRYAKTMLEPLAPGQINWFNPEHIPCHTRWKQISLDETIADDVVEADPNL